MFLVKRDKAVRSAGAPAGGSEGDGIMDDAEHESAVGRVIEGAMKALNEAESLWETDHGSPRLRDSFCLLRSYLGQIGRFRDDNRQNTEIPKGLHENGQKDSHYSAFR
jgi:hypothetical protein